MASLTAACVLFMVLLGLEWLFWLSPFKRSIERLEKRAGRVVDFFPPQYMVRLLVLYLVLQFFKVDLWPPFSGGVNWIYSAALGGVLMGLTYLMARPRPKSGVNSPLAC